jgi:3-hydroxyacyl-[acyl-carrier-protein] dehydratase
MRFRFVDRIVSWAAYREIAGLKTVSFEEYDLRATHGEEPRLPETLVLESVLELGNWLLLLSSDFTQMGVVVRLTEVRFHRPLRPGQVLRMEVRLDRRTEDGFEFSGLGSADGQTVVSGAGCLAAAAPAADYYEPESLRVLFSELYQPENALVS